MKCVLELSWYLVSNISRVSLMSLWYHGGVDLTGLKPDPLHLSSFSALTLLVGSFDP